MSRQEKIELLALLDEKERRENHNTTVVGLVDPKQGLTHCVTRVNGEWVTTKKNPTVFLAARMERVLTSKKRFVIVVGGRGSSKSVGVVDVCAIDAKDTGAKTYFLREFQSSIKNSVYSLIKDEIARLGFPGFDVQQAAILRKGNPVFEFAGLARNIDSIKSSHGFQRFSVEEAQFLSEESLEALTPTARNKPNKGLPKRFVEENEGLDEKDKKDELAGVQMIFIANPGSSEDPFSKRFLVPYQSALDEHGFYEDDLHLIIKMNYYDNPWFLESGLEEERAWAESHLSTAEYKHIWEGDYNDSVENSLILAEWFDACVDAHLKLGFEPRGAVFSSHDPSDTGPDPKGYAMRHGFVILDVDENTEGNVNEGGHWACGRANQQNVDHYTWDCDGMGVGLSEQTAKAFKGKKTTVTMFKGSESPDFPDAVYQPALAGPVVGQKKNRDVFRNKRVQYYSEVRDRVYRTYRAVVHKEYCDPDKMISFSSKIPKLTKLRSELTRLPIKPNGSGLMDLYTKEEMKRKFKLPSPNLADCIMMLCRVVLPTINAPVIPKPIKPIHKTRRR